MIIQAVLQPQLLALVIVSLLFARNGIPRLVAITSSEVYANIHEQGVLFILVSE